MINDMLDIARSDAGAMAVSMELMDLGDIVASVSYTHLDVYKRQGHLRSEGAGAGRATALRRHHADRGGLRLRLSLIHI